jgi:hypothetical protein
MEFNIRLKLVGTLIMAALLSSACQSFIPHAQGLSSPSWVAQSYQRQDQIEVQWNNNSFSFLLYQQQNDKKLDMVALSLTGQQLFKLNFDGEKVVVEQRINQMKLLPFEYVVRDLLYATYPNFEQQQKDQVNVVVEDSRQKIFIKNSHVLDIDKKDDVVELKNVQVPYEMVISAVSESLENDEDSNAQ